MASRGPAAERLPCLSPAAVKASKTLAARGGDFDPERSDADFLYRLRPPLRPGIFKRHMGLIKDLEAVLGRDVDIVEIGSADNRHPRESIDRSRDLVYDSMERPPDPAARRRPSGRGTQCERRRAVDRIHFQGGSAGL